jgi:hypothetical protein
MARPIKPDLTTLIGRKIVAVHQQYLPQEPCRPGDWCVSHLTLDDGTEIAFSVHEREVEYAVNLIHRKGVVHARD